MASLLYFTTVILLHRPFLPTASHQTACLHIVTQIELLLLEHEKVFGFGRITYLMAYCIYTAASVSLADVKAGDPGAVRRMQTFLRALQGGLATCPVLQRSLDIIAIGLKPDNQATVSSRTAQVNANPADSGFAHSLHTTLQPDQNETMLAQDFGLGQQYVPSQSTADLLPAFLFPQSPLTAPAPWDHTSDYPDPFNFLENFPEARFAGLPEDWFASS